MGTTADKLTYLNETKGKIKDSINLTGAGITNNDTFRSYATKLRDGLVQVLNDNGEALYNNFPKVSGSGSEITLENTLEAPMKNGTIDGNTLQDGEPTPDTPVEIQSVEGIQNVEISGKNLFNGIFETGGYDTTNGNKSASNDRIRCTDFIKVNSGETYTWSFENAGSAYVLEYDENKTYLNKYTLIMYHTVSGSVTLSSLTKYITFYYIPYNHTLTLNEQCQLEKDSIATTYEEYKTPQNYEVNLGSIKLYNGDKIVGTPDNWSIERNWKENNINLNGNYYNASSTQRYAWFEKPKDSIDYNNWSSNIIGEVGNLVGTGNKYSYGIIFNPNIYTDQEIIDKCDGTNYIYKLSTPTTEQITDTYLISQLNVLYNAKSYNGQTNISVSGNLPMILEVSALKDEI